MMGCEFKFVDVIMCEYIINFGKVIIGVMFKKCVFCVVVVVCVWLCVCDEILEWMCDVMCECVWMCVWGCECDEMDGYGWLKCVWMIGCCVRGVDVWMCVDGRMSVIDDWLCDDVCVMDVD